MSDQEPFKLKLRDDRPATIGERRALLNQIEELKAQRDALNGDVHRMGQEIERLRNQLVTARTALEPFAALPISQYHQDGRPLIYGLTTDICSRLTIGHVRAAKAALSDEQQ